MRLVKRKSNKRKSNKRKLNKPEELAFFCNSLYFTIKAGLPSLEGLEMMLEDMPNGEMKEEITELKKKCEEGVRFSEALGTSGKFPEYMTETIKLAHLLGREEESMAYLAQYYEKQATLKTIVKSAIMGPSVLIVIILGVLMVLSMKVIPLFEQLFRNMGSHLSNTAQMLVCIVDFFEQFNGIILFVLLGAILVLLVLRKAYGDKWLRGFKERFKVTEKIATFQLAEALNLALKSGLGIEEAMELTIPTIEHTKVKNKCEVILQKLQEGESFRRLLGEIKLFSPMMTKLLQLGIEVGELDSAMEKVSNRYEEEVQQHIQSIVGMLEPSIVGILCLLVSIILLSVMLPLMNIMSAIS